MIQEIVEGQNLRSETFLPNRFYSSDKKKWESSLGKEKRVSNQIRVAQKAKVISAMCHYKIQIHSTQ